MRSESEIKLHDEIFSRLKSIIVDLLRVSQEKISVQIPEITIETDLVDDLGLDSVEMLDLTTAISAEFGVNPDAGQMINVRTIDDAVKYILELKSKS